MKTKKRKEKASNIRKKKIRSQIVSVIVAGTLTAFSFPASEANAFSVHDIIGKSRHIASELNMTKGIPETFPFEQMINKAVKKTRVNSYGAVSLPTEKEITVNNLKISAISVSCLKVTWDADDNRGYDVQISTSADYSENISLVNKKKGIVYLTGLRENSDYIVTVIPEITSAEKKQNYTAVSAVVAGKTEKVLPLVDYQREEGWTCCFAAEKASGLTRMPSSGAIKGTINDPVTDTGIRRNAYGDYCCAMGLWYGEVGDRFLVELDNGIQFTTQICDSKGWADDADGDGIGDGRFHWFGGDGKCVIEFVYNDGSLPQCVRRSGSWGGYDWNGLNLSANIKSIKKIALRGSGIEY